MNGLLRCSRYAFGPNRLHYCGPDANHEIAAYLQNKVEDPGLEGLLKAFQTMYPYLQLIAEDNLIKDPFDEKVVEAYWIGNSLLDAVEKKKFCQHLLDAQKIKKRSGREEFDKIVNKVLQGAVPQHSFHVLNVWKRTGHAEQEHTLSSLDACRISWGTVKKIDGPFVVVEVEPLVEVGGKLILGESVSKKILRSFGADIDLEELKVGDIVSMHWETICEKITSQQAAALRKYTLKHLEFVSI